MRWWKPASGSASNRQLYAGGMETRQYSCEFFSFQTKNDTIHAIFVFHRRALCNKFKQATSFQLLGLVKVLNFWIIFALRKTIVNWSFSRNITYFQERQASSGLACHLYGACSWPRVRAVSTFINVWIDFSALRNPFVLDLYSHVFRIY